MHFSTPHSTSYQGGLGEEENSLILGVFIYKCVCLLTLDAPKQVFGMPLKLHDSSRENAIWSKHQKSDGFL